MTMRYKALVMTLKVRALKTKIKMLNWTSPNKKYVYFKTPSLQNQVVGWREGWVERAQRNFRTVQTLCMILSWWTHVTIYLSQPIECTTPRMNPKVNYGLGVIMMCLCRFINCDKCIILLRDADNGRHYTFVGARATWEISSLYLPHNFTTTLKLFYKNKQKEGREEREEKRKKRRKEGRKGKEERKSKKRKRKGRKKEKGTTDWKKIFTIIYLIKHSYPDYEKHFCSSL